MMQFIDLKAQSARIETPIFERFKAIMNHGQYIMGPEIKEIETVLAEFTGVKHALTVSSGTDALLIALMALGIGPGDEVPTTPFSFFATAEAIALIGGIPVFVDIDPHTYNMDPAKLEAVIGPKTKAIMPVSLYGQCADMDAINAIAEKYNIPVIEDAAQSFGAEYKGRRSGGLTAIGCTSFFPSKPLGCYGDGGACFTNDDELAKKMAEIRVHGQSRRYYHTSLGINGRMDTMQAAVLLEKMAIFEEEIRLRQIVAQRYEKLLPKEIKRQRITPENISVFAQYTIEVDERQEVQKLLEARGIPTAIHYPVGLHQQPVFQKMFPGKQVFKHTESAAERVMSIPMHPYMEESDQIKVVDALQEVLEEVSEIAEA